jgi:hypothetical protein
MSYPCLYSEYDEEDDYDDYWEDDVPECWWADQCAEAADNQYEAAKPQPSRSELNLNHSP